LLTVLTAVPALSLAAGVPHIFTAGTAISSAQVNENFADLADRLTSIEARPVTTTYVRWGRTTCGNDAQAVYDGYVAGRHTIHVGSGSGSLCLHRTPEWLEFNDADQNGALLYGTEYRTLGYVAGLDPAQNFEAECVVCEVPRATQLTIPGRTSCPAGWTLEYNGYLMSHLYTDNGSDWLCVDAAPEQHGTAGVLGGHLFYPTEIECGALPCAPDGYVQDREVACAVCSK
jgi:hypothetical protein